jgi:hypothetical protein
MDLNVANTRMLAIRDGATVGAADEVSVAHDIAQIATLLIPYSGTSLQLLETISSGSYSCSAARLEFCSSTGFFENTFQFNWAVGSSWMQRETWLPARPSPRKRAMTTPRR